MIDRVASNMLGEMPWPPTMKQGIGVGIALAEVGMAMYLWDRAKKGGLSLKPWQLRSGAVIAGTMALWAIFNVRTANGSHPAQQPQLQPPASSYPNVPLNPANYVGYGR